MTPLCTDSASLYLRLRGVFPQIPQDAYHAHHTEHQDGNEDISDINPKCDKPTYQNLDKSQQFLIPSYVLDKSLRYKRHTSLQQAEEFPRSDIAVSSLSQWNLIRQKKHILSTLDDHVARINAVTSSPLFHADRRQRELIALEMNPLRSLIVDTKLKIEAASTLSDINNLLGVLHDQITSRLVSLESIVLSRLAAAFEDQRSAIWLDTEELITRLKSRRAFDATKMEVLSYLRFQCADMERVKTLSRGHLSEDAVQILQKGFEERNRQLARAVQAIQATTTNSRIQFILRVLRIVVVHHARQNHFISILLTPQRKYLRKHILSIPSDLIALQTQPSS